MALVAAVGLLGGCAAEEGPVGVSPRETAVASLAASLELASPVHHVDRLAREPMLVEHPDGTLFVSGYGSQSPESSHPKQVPYLWRSGDGGASWERVDVGTAAEGAIGNSDVDLAVAGDGTLYFLTMGFDRDTGRGTHIAIGVSHDVGSQWSWTLLSETEYDDRPWVVVAPGGIAHVVWNDGGGVRHAVSSDQGRTWSERERIHSRGGSSHLAVGPEGELAVRISPLSASGNRYDEGVDLIVVSTDGGESWRKHAPPGAAKWPIGFEQFAELPRWVEPLAWDGAGRLYHLWGDRATLWLGRSADRGATWESWPIARDNDRIFFPYLVAAGPGELAASWFTGQGESLAVRLARVNASPEGGAAEPTVRASEPFQLDVWRAVDGSFVRDTGGEYVALAFLSSGRLAAATPIQDPGRERFGFSLWLEAAP